MKKSKSNISSKNQSSMANQKINEDFNKVKPQPNDFPGKINVQKKEIFKDGIDVEETSIDETREEKGNVNSDNPKEKGFGEKEINEGIVNGDSIGKFDINQEGVININNELIIKKGVI